MEVVIIKAVVIQERHADQKTHLSDKHGTYSASLLIGHLLWAYRMLFSNCSQGLQEHLDGMDQFRFNQTHSHDDLVVSNVCSGAIGFISLSVTQNAMREKHNEVVVGAGSKEWLLVFAIHFLIYKVSYIHLMLA